MVDRAASSFQAAFDRLSSTEQVAFVAELYRAQGWTVEVDGQQLSMRDDERTRTLYIGAPSLAGNVDAVVPVSGPAGAVHTAISRQLPGADAGTNVDTISIDELRQQLLYALDREQATALCEDHFDGPFEQLTGLSAEDKSDGNANRGRPRSIRSGAIGVVAVVLLTAVVVAVLVGPAALVDSPVSTAADDAEDLSGADGDTATATDDASGDASSEDERSIGGDTATADSGTEPTSSTTPDWLDGGELASLDQLLADHRNETGSLSGATLTVEYEGPSSLIDFDGAEPIGENRSRAVYETGPESPDASGDGSLVHYAGDGTAVEVSHRSMTRNSEPVIPAPGSMFKGNGAPLLQTYLDPTNQLVTPLTGEGGEAVFSEDADGLYAIFANRPPESIADDVTGFQADGLVTARGLVQEFQVTYSVDGEQVSIAFEFER